MRFLDFIKYSEYLDKIDEEYKYHHSQVLTKYQEKSLCVDLLKSELTIKEIMIKFNISLSVILRFNRKYNLPRKVTVYNTNNCISVDINFFEKLDNEKSIYWAGFILGDGTISKNDNRWGASLVIGLWQNDKSHLEKFAKDIKYGGEIKDSEPCHNKTKKFYKKSVISIHRLKICNDLINHGIDQNKSKTCCLPKSIPDKLMHHFIRGLADADACWHVNKMGDMLFSMTSSVHEFLIELREYLGNKLGLNKNIVIHSKKGCWSLVYIGNVQCNKIYKYLYDNCTVYLDRKFEYCRNFFEIYDNKPKKFQI